LRVADYEIPEELIYTKEDEWVRREGDHVVIGVTDFAQNQLGDIVFVELPEVGTATEAGVPFGTIESVKAVSDLFAPISGEVLSINEALEDKPELVNEACYGEGWLFSLRPSDPGELDRLLDAKAYRASVSERES
jgi:glycine cleavage system H protein